jgi:membrane dipeptidase
VVHARSNALAGSSQDPVVTSRTRGLTPAGRRLAEHVVARGALLDVAHASDATIDDLVVVARAAGAPLVDSHTGMRSLVASERNLDDGRARAIAASGGVIGISLHSGHVSRRTGERATLDDYVAHLERAIAVAGEDHVAIGSDLAGAIVQPSDADGAATWPALALRLRARGWTEARLHAVLHANAERVSAWSSTHGCTPLDVRRK